MPIENTIHSVGLMTIVVSSRWTRILMPEIALAQILVAGTTRAVHDYLARKADLDDGALDRRATPSSPARARSTASALASAPAPAGARVS